MVDDEPSLPTEVKRRASKYEVRQAHARQKGVYAIEFGLVFLIFFITLYAVITYGLIFALQQSLNSAAESGARAALEWAPDIQTRSITAEQRAKEVTLWLNELNHSDALEITSCYEGSPTSCQTDNCPNLPVSAQLNPGEITIALCYHYNSEQGRLIPLIGPSQLVSLAVPAVLQASATVNLQIASQQQATSTER